MKHPATLLLAGVLVMATLSACSLPHWPIDDGAAITSPYGLRWQGVLPAVHRGVDIQASAGTPVHAMAGGRVRYAGWMTGYGNVVWLDHRENLMSIYAHLSELRIEAGASVERGAVVGLVGSTGTATAAHLHFEVRMNGRPVDPVAFLGRRP